MQRWIKTLLSIMLLVSTMNVFAQREEDPVFEQGVEAYKRGDHATAFKLWLSRAEQGEMSAQFNVGRMYDDGDGVEQDKQQALKWYSQAALLGDARALYNLGTLYANGEGIERDWDRAKMYFKQACKAGLPEGCDWE
ncbi:TPA: sel1 repeat family protein [Pasteurella multocida]|nr:sel1 repeat family protein [Pasteurella multocida]